MSKNIFTAYELKEPISPLPGVSADCVMAASRGNNAFLALWDSTKNKAIMIRDDSNNLIKAPVNWKDLIIS